MSTFSSANIVKNNIFTKPYLLTNEELSQIGNNINLVGYDPLKSLPSVDESIVNFKYGNPSSPRLLNYVEPYTIAGIDYTLFYSEVNTGLNIGDKVFIINGSYDSNSLIITNKYKKGRDGYKVLYVDKCKIVLDIEFVGYLPANETSENQEVFDDFIKVYYVKDQNEFLHVNRQITTRGATFSYKFNPYQNNIIFISTTFSAINNGLNKWGNCLGVSGTGFFIKNDDLEWTDITGDFINGYYEVAKADSTNGKILIQNGNFSYNNVDYKEDSVYSWDVNLNQWILNIKHENNNPPIISKSNFRDGQFDGIWNGGLYGTNEKRITWNSSTATWNSGTLLNTTWKTGIMNSLYSQYESYFSEFDYSFATSSAPYGLPYQKINNPDNNGYGYNFVINSDIQNAVINNGNVTNTKLGVELGTYSIIEDYVKNGVTSVLNKFEQTGLTINKALFDNCKFINANIENTEIRNSRSINSRFNKVKSVNSHYQSSLFTNSNYISDNIIKVLDYDELTYTSSGSGQTHQVYKFYINKRSYEKFKFKDSFYIKGIVIKDNTKDLINFFDKKFKIGPWTEYIDDINNGDYYKRGFEYSAFISSPKENEYIYNVNGNDNIIGDPKNKDYYSVDIFVSKKDINFSDQNNNIDFRNKLDFSNAYIINSDFESGIFENSNWNGGNHINYNNDVSITKSPTASIGYYDMIMDKNSNKITLNIPNVNEVEDDYLLLNDIIFLNAVDYDTRGKVIQFSIYDKGSGYTESSNVSTIGGSGTGLTLSIFTEPIGSVVSITLSTTNTLGYTPAYVIGSYSLPVYGGSGTGLEVDIVVDLSYNITSIVPNLNNLGTGYLTTDINLIVGTSSDWQGGDRYANIDIIDILNGGIYSTSSIGGKGLGYKKDDIITINGGLSPAKIKIDDIEGELTRLPDTYKISQLIGSNTKVIEPIIGTFSNLLDDGLFLTDSANNKYGYLHKSKFNKSRISSGVFKRAYIQNSLIKDESYDISDKDFKDITRLKNLIIVDTIFSNNNNILSKATYMNSFFVGGNDIWDNGILYDSIWNGMNFNNGLVKESIWINGTFSNGLFYNSKSFDNDQIFDYNQNTKSRYYKSGTESNARFSWQNGTFLNGEFYKSDWEDGIFNGGKFYYSKFYNGTFNNGIIGDKSIPMENTWFYNGTINYAVVENSKVISKKYSGISNSTITWNDGIFNSGVFGTDDTKILTNSATWSYGIFNGGEFTDSAKWKNGTFNGGKFISNYGFTNSVVDNVDNGSLFQIKEDYAWEYGIFNGGEFGNANTATNSTWFDGEFNGGQFKGRVWNNGIFSFGEFLGSGDIATGVVTGGAPSIILQSNPGKFVNSYNGITKKYYGLWRDGYVTDIKDKYITDKKLYTDIKRVNDNKKVVNKAILKNMLWMKGTFTHPSGEMNNSVWLDGKFENGQFLSSSFNPYVTRNNANGSGTTDTFNFSDTCSWKNGIFDGGEFNISTWDNGTFISGTATGMIWKNGVTNYMNAYNVFWEDGLWRNGNWNGSYFNLTATGSVIDNYTLQVLHNGMSFSATSSVHVWNIFYNESLSDHNLLTSTTTGFIFIAGTATDSAPSWGPGSTFSEVGGTTPELTIDYSLNDPLDGGYVAYILQSGDTGYDANQQHGLIVYATYPSGDPQYLWASANTLVGVNGIDIGTGLANSLAIMSAFPSSETAASIVSSQIGNGYYLPSQQELFEILANADAGLIPGFIGDGTIPNWGQTSRPYWSSTETSNSTAYSQVLDHDAFGPDGKGFYRYIIGVKSF